LIGAAIASTRSIAIAEEEDVSHGRGPWTTRKDRLVDILRKVDRQNLPVVAGGLAFFALLSASPLLIAIVSLYGLIADPLAVEDQINRLATILPPDVQLIVADQLRAIVALSRDGLSIGTVLSVGTALWIASKGTFYLLRSLNNAFGLVETRSIPKVKALSVLITAMLAIGSTIAFALVAVLPPVVAIALGHSRTASAIELARWPVLALTMTLVLSLLYRYGPNHEPGTRWRWWTPGSAAATIGFLAGSYGFSYYVSSFEKFNETYGSLGAVVVLMTWLYCGAFLVLLGALVDATRRA
jgi:membrane protein